LRSRLWDVLERELPAVRSKRLIAINPNASKLIEIRKWPRERYAELTRRLLDDPQYVCVITGVASEYEDAAFIKDHVQSDRVLDLTGKTTLRELLELFTMADLLVTNDSGPAHFAALTRIRTVVFFGPETPDLYRPLSDRCTVLYANYACSPCVSAYNQRLSPCTDNRCLTHFSVDHVYATAVAALAEGA
jgi:ADP-heptose:LPS heptosyltransferase